MTNASKLKIRNLSDVFKFFCYIAAIGLPIYYWFPMLYAKWGLIDDHEILAFIGPYGHLPFSNILDTLHTTEISVSSTLPRFRPTYYLFRIFESVAWGKNSSLWYGFRMLISILFGITLARLSIIVAGPIIGFGFILFSLSQSYWADIFTKAGPSEIYSVFGCTLLILLFCIRRKKKYYSLTDCVLISFAVVIASGSKENFLFLGLIPLYILLNKDLYKPFSAKIILALPIAYTAWIVYMLVPRLKAGTDVYQNEASIYSKLILIKSLLVDERILIIVSLILGSILLGIFCKILFRQSLINNGVVLFTSYLKFFKWQILLLAIFSSQYLIYHGVWSAAASRYFFPAILVFHFSLLLSISFAIHILSLFNFSKGKIASLQIIGLAIYLSFTVGHFSENRKIALHSAQITLDFNKKFNYVEEVLRHNPRASLIIVTNHPTDYESIIAINRFLYSEGVSNKIGVMLNELSYQEEPSDGSNIKWLKGALAEISRNGALPKTRDMYFDPISKLDIKNCIAVSLSGDPISECEYGNLRLWN